MISSFILHHRSDIDGYGSAAIAAQYLDNFPFYIESNTVPVNHNVYDFNKIKNFISKSKGHVWIFVLDFTFSEKEMKWLVDNSDKFFWVDHHSTVYETYKNITKYITEDGSRIWKEIDPKDKYFKKYFIDFDNNNEQAAIKLIYNMLFPKNDENTYVNYISDIDIWKIASPETINFREFIHKMPWKNYKFLKSIIFKNKFINSVISEESTLPIIYKFGEIFQQRKREQVSKACKRFISGIYNGYKICIVNNTNSEINNEILNNMCAKEKFDIAFSYFDDLVNDNRGFSIRTNRDDIHVGKLAEKLGTGGGHPKSAGFSIKLQKGIELINLMTKGNLYD